MRTELALNQKLDALANKYYQFVKWSPKKGDYYTTSRNDLQLCQIVDEDEKHFYTNYCDPSLNSDNEPWIKDDFLKDFGKCRVYVPEWVFESVSPGTKTKDKDRFTQTQRDYNGFEE